MGELGFGNEHAIVVYDEGPGTVAARLWWMLDALGHPDVRLLDGGVRAWVDAGRPLSRDAAAHPPAKLTLSTSWPRTLDRERIASRGDGQVLLDLRAGERYRGEVEPVDPVAGHIPGARSLPALRLAGEDGRLLGRAALRERLESVAGAEAIERGDVAVSCGSGVTACLGALAMRVAGLPDPRLYPGSYSDWSRSGMPIATGDEGDQG
jgi:thiosulfate/3-mercaptopyruvate sulfurtransferase